MRHFRTFYLTVVRSLRGKASLLRGEPGQPISHRAAIPLPSPPTLKAMPDHWRAQRFSREPVGCTPRHYSGWTAPCLPCARISAGTMRSTRPRLG